MKASILFYSLPPPNSTAPRTIEYRSPCIPCRSRVLSNPSLYTPTCICLDLVFFVDLRLHKARRILFYIFFATYFYGGNDATASSPIGITLHAVSPNYIPLLRPSLSWLLCVSPASSALVANDMTFLMMSTMFALLHCLLV